MLIQSQPIPPLGDSRSVIVQKIFLLYSLLPPSSVAHVAVVFETLLPSPAIAVDAADAAAAAAAVISHALLKSKICNNQTP